VVRLHYPFVLSYFFLCLVNSWCVLESTGAFEEFEVRVEWYICISYITVQYDILVITKPESIMLA